MPDAKASGADAGAARSREHNQGNQGRSYTVEQKAAVLRIRRCNATAFYDILGLESVRASCTETEIKKAYRKQSLLTHPDKNGHEHAAEAFKMVSRAFGILGDKEKKEKYDRHGTDPDSRFANAQSATPGFNGGFGRRDPFGGQGHGFGGEEMTPEEMFARFFGGGGGFGGGPFRGGFDAGPQFVFNFGGGPGVRVHQFGGARPRRRPQEANEQDYSTAGLQNMLGILPIVLFFVFPLLTSLFSGGGDSVSYAPNMNFDVPLAPMTEGRTMPRSKVSYFVNPKDIRSYSPSKLKQLDATAEIKFFRDLQTHCNRETAKQQHLYDEASGWFFDDPVKMAAAEAHPKPSCERLAKFSR